jgi:cell division protein FtsI/penicillin-binding protein 2
MAGLGVRLYHLVVYTGVESERKLQMQQLMTLADPGKPGGIYIRAYKSFVPVAESRPVPSIYVDPNMIEEGRLAETAIKLGGVLNIPPVRVQELIFLRHDRRFAWIKREVDDMEANTVKFLRLPGVGIAYEWRREYPCGGLAGTVVGFPPLEDANVASGAGIERRLRDVMKPEDGHRVAVVDVGRRPVQFLPDKSKQPRDGDSVMLYIDASIQGFLEKAVADAVSKNQARWGAGVVVNPFTGEVLAMYSAPGVNPNEYAHADPNWRTNRVIEMPYEPGSVAKPIFAAAAVENKLATYDTMIFCENGTYSAPRGGTISDHGNHYGWLSLHDILVHSSNIGMAKVGEKMGNRLIREAALRFGLGQETGIDLPGESPGILRSWTRPDGTLRWDGYSMRRVPFGQEISTTTIQLAMAFAALANGGELLRPRIVDRVIDPDRRTVREFPRTVVRRVLSKSVADQTVLAMIDVVERGTGSACKASPWTMFGKTGTAQIARNGVYVENAFVSSFVGGAPARSPRALCLVSVYWPNYSIGHFGAKVSAPAVKEVLEQTMAYLDVPPDKNVAVASSE